MKLGYWVYKIARGGARATGIAGLLRATLGPSVAQFIFNRTTGAGKATVVNGHRMVLAEDGQYPPFAMATDKYEVGTTRLLENVIKPGMVVVDIGAHVGYFTLLAARQVGTEGRVYSFEPEPTNFRLLQENIKANGYQNVLATQKAVSDAAGSAQLVLSSRDNGTHSLFGHSTSEENIVSVKVTSLDEFLTGEGWPKVDFIKMDVEGAEMKAFEGMKRVLKGFPEVKLVMEFNPALLRNASVDPADFLNKPSEFGFSISVIEDPDGTKPLDASSLTAELLNSEGSVNLYCHRI